MAKISSVALAEGVALKRQINSTDRSHPIPRSNTNSTFTKKATLINSIKGKIFQRHTLVKKLVLYYKTLTLKNPEG